MHTNVIYKSFPSSAEMKTWKIIENICMDMLWFRSVSSPIYLDEYFDLLNRKHFSLSNLKRKLLVTMR